jgi:hypothetical protein
MESAMKTTDGKWHVQTGKGARSSYRDRYTFPADKKSQALLYYYSINIGNDFKKRLVDPEGNVRARQFGERCFR